MIFVRKFSELPSKAILPSHEQLLHQINRNLLRFDKEFRSCINLETQNLYMCLCCGQIFCGGKLNSQIIAHFGETNHSIALNLENSKFIILPTFDPLPKIDGLFDIEFACHPYYDEKILNEIIKKQKEGILLQDSKKIFPCALSFDINPAISSQLSVLRFFTRITPIRDYLLCNSLELPLSYTLSKFMKLYCNPFSFQDKISPYDVLYAIQELSNHDFLIDKECDPAQLLSFILSSLNSEIGKENVSSFIRGSLNIFEYNEDLSSYSERKQRFWCLPLDPMESPLYRSGLEKEKIIPCVDLNELLDRYNGETMITQNMMNQKVINRKMKLNDTKEFLWINVNRIRPSVFGFEKLNIHITLPHNSLNLTNYGVKQKYDLVAIISHEGDVKDGYYITYIKNESGTWLKCGVSDIEVTFEEISYNSQCCHLLYQIQT